MQVIFISGLRMLTAGVRRALTGNDLGPLKILVWMDVAWPQSKIDPHQEKRHIDAPPHTPQSCSQSHSKSPNPSMDRGRRCVL